MGGGSSKDSFHVVPGFSHPVILDKYDGFLVDQWGVMHNGKEAMEGAPECIAELATIHGKKMVILSNSPSSEAATLEALLGLRFNPAHFEGGAITSGDLASDYILEHYGTKGKKCKALFMAWDDPAAPFQAFLDRCGTLELVTSFEGEEPNVLIVQGNQVLLGEPRQDGTGRENVSLGDFVVSGQTEGIIDTILKECVTRQIPLLCVDPDFVTYNPDGTTFFMPGTVAKRFEELGGTCQYFGKPHTVAFERGIERLKSHGITDTSRMAMIGDSLHHDVQGANALGLDSILVLGGVHRKELGHSLGEMVEVNHLRELFLKHHQTPTIVAPVLRL